MHTMENLAAEWRSQLHECQYAGELAIHEENLSNLANEIRQRLWHNSSCDTRVCMLVLAINCMYYRHDEQGFWTHFCDLLDTENTIDTQSRLGHILERQLIAFRLLAGPGFGPFRYVTAIRKQCGITRKEIPRFATILSGMATQYGWDGIRVLSQAEITDFASARFPNGLLTNFLTSAEGHAFVRDIARNVSQYQRNIVSRQELDTLTGYRTGFFNELFDALTSIPQQQGPAVTRPPLPRFMFFPDASQVGLSFDPRGITNSAYKINGAMVRQNPLLWQDSNDFQNTLNGERRDSNGQWTDWEIPGWSPNENSVALFHVDKGYFEIGNGIRPGEYFMLGPYSDPPPQEVLRGDYGAVDLPFPNLDYDAWRITISQDTDLSFLGMEQIPVIVSTDLIAWSETATRLEGAVNSDSVFTGALPYLKVRRPELFATGDVALFIDTGEGARRLPIDAEDNELNLDITVPSHGRIWVEPISRLREFSGLDTLGELCFCLLPECRIEWPGGLYSQDEQPEVLLSADAEGLSLELMNATALDNARKRWKMNSGETVIHGHVVTPQFRIPIARRLYRASLRSREHRVLGQMLEGDIQSNDTYVLTGLPREEVLLTITAGVELRPLGNLGICNQAGECRFPGSAIRDSISSWNYPAGVFAIEYQGNLVKTTTHYLDSHKLIQWICEADDLLAPPIWADGLILPVRQMFDITRRIMSARLPEVSPLKSTDDLPETIHIFFQTVRACAVIFDDSVLPDIPQITQEDVPDFDPPLPKEVSQLLDWYRGAVTVTHAGENHEGITAQHLLERYDGLHWVPPFPRWKQAIYNVLEHIKADIETLPLVEEWMHDIEGGYHNVYPSRIAQKHHGRTLTMAWIGYLHSASYQTSINRLVPEIDQFHSPVSDLAGILLILCYLRSGQFESQPALTLDSNNQQLGSVLNEMSTLVQLGCPEGGEIRPNFNALSRFMPVMPLRPEDKAFVKAVQTGQVDPDHAGDWLTSYYLCRLFTLGVLGQRPPQVANLGEIIDRLPISPERNRIIDALEGN